MKLYFQIIKYLYFRWPFKSYDVNHKGTQFCLTNWKYSKSMTLSWPVIMCNKPRLEISIRHAIHFLSTFNEIDCVNYRHADFIIFYTEGHSCLLDYHVNMQHLAFFSIFGSTRMVEIDSKELNRVNSLGIINEKTGRFFHRSSN